MSWSYRLMQREEYGETLLYIVEVYLDKDNSIMGWTKNEAVYGESIEEIRQTLTWMTEALDKPILVESALLAELEPALD